MEELINKMMVANARNADLSRVLWNSLVIERAAHTATKTELEGLRERVDKEGGQ